MAGPKINIAIIGGGASGTITAIQLLRKLNVKAKVYLIEKRKEGIFRGAAYSGVLPYEPLNVTASRMSIFNHLPDDFYNWLKENKQSVAEEEITKDTFVSRRWFGDYISYHIQRLASLAKLAQLEVINATATDINFDVKTNSYQLALDDSRLLQADYLVFATGNESPYDILKSNSEGLAECYTPNPWTPGVLEKIGSTDDVLIIGTGLTMVDYVVSLKKRGHTGKVYALSRNGYLPLPHTNTQDFVFDLYEELKDIRQLFLEVKKRFVTAEAKGVAWQNVLDAMRPRVPRLWKGLDADSKKYFLSRFKTFWEIHRHRMPEASSKAIIEMEQSGQFVLLAGNIVQAVKREDRIEFSYKPRQTAEVKTLPVDYIINCTGPLSDYYKCGNGLIINLLNKGWMQQDDLKIGIKTGVRGEVIQQNGVVLQNAFCVGPLRKAMEWESTAVREIRTHAENVAFHIAGKTEHNYEMEVEIGL